MVALELSPKVKERIKSILGFILVGFIWFTVMYWVLPKLGIRT